MDDNGEWRVFLGIDGFTINSPSFLLGKTIFHRVDDGFLDYVRNIHGGPGSAIPISFFCRENLGSVAAELKTTGSQTEAVRTAIEKLELALDGVLFLARRYVIHPYATRFTIRGRATPGEYTAYCINIAARRAGQHTRHSFSRLPVEFGIDDGDISSNSSLSHLHAILSASSDELTDLEKRFRLGLHWYSKAFYSEYPADRLVFFVLILDLMLKRKGEQNYTAKVAKRLSKLLCSAEPARNVSPSDVSGVYRIRGDVVHDGLASVPDSVINDVEDWVHALMYIALHNPKSWASRDNLIDFIENEIPN